MVLDVVGVILIALFFIRGFMKGLIVAVFSVVAILLGAMCALKLSASFSSWLLDKGYVTSGWVQVISYLVLFIGVVIIVRLAAGLISKSMEGMALGLVNKLFGGFLYAFLGAVVWSSFLWLGNKLNIITPSAVAESKTYSWLSRLAPWVFEHTGKVVPYVRDTFSSLEHFFDKINTRNDVGAH